MGSRKTFAYRLPMLQKLFVESCSRKSNPVVFILVPTRELCHQVHAEALSLFEFCRVQLKVVQLLSNMTNSEMSASLAGPPDVLVSTPDCISMCISKGVLQTLQDSLMMLVLDELDTGARLCIRDSLFRLAKSAVERQSISDRSSISGNGRDEDEVLANEETNNQNRCARLQDVETYTNPTDRAVAHLLFYRASDSCARSVKEEIPQSPTSGNPGQIHGVKSEGPSESFKEMEVQTY